MSEFHDDVFLLEDTPVTMPAIPPTRVISTEEEFKAVADATRTRILGIIQQQPATAKQIAARLDMSPGTIGHHLQVLEAAGLAQVVARRLVRGIVAKYYTRTARVFLYQFPAEVTGYTEVNVSFIDHLKAEYSETLAERNQEQDCEDIETSGFPHLRLSEERAREFSTRMKALMDEFIEEPYDPEGQVYSLFMMMFKAPSYLQPSTKSEPSIAEESDGKNK